MGQNIVKGERMGLSPLAVSELAKEFRRLAAYYEQVASWPSPVRYVKTSAKIRARTWNQAAQMLEEKLS